MVTLVKHEWHQVDSRFAVEIDEDILSQIYPDFDEDEIADVLFKIENGDIAIEDLLHDAEIESVEIEWEAQHDDWWTMRKGGYDVTYEVGDENSWHVNPQPDPPTHKCTKCRWKGLGYETWTKYYRADGSVIEDYLDSDEEADHTSDICPMCDSDVEMTEAGKQKELESEERLKEIKRFLDEEDSDNDQI